MKWTLILTTLGVSGVIAANAADQPATREQRRIQNEQQAVRGDIDQRIQSINRLDNRETAKMAGYAAVSKETAVPLPQIQAEHKEHPKLGLAGLFMAHEIATHTHKPVDQLIRQRESGRTWNQIAVANGEDLAAIDAKLTRIEDAMRNPTSAASPNAATSATDRTAVRERETATGLGGSINALNALGDKPAVRSAALAAASKETAVPLPTIEEAQKRNASAGLGDLFAAQELATHTQKPVDELLKLHSDGKSWSDIAKENNQDVNVLEAKLQRIEQATRSAGQ